MAGSVGRRNTARSRRDVMVTCRDCGDVLVSINRCQLRRCEDDGVHSLAYRCRSCGQAEHGDATGTPMLHIRMKAHLTVKHGWVSSDEWKISHQERSASQSMVCFWPPEAL